MIVNIGFAVTQTPDQFKSVFGMNLDESIYILDL